MRPLYAVLGLGAAAAALLYYEEVVKKSVATAPQGQRLVPTSHDPNSPSTPIETGGGPNAPGGGPLPGTTAAAPKGTTLTPGQLFFRNVPSVQPGFI